MTRRTGSARRGLAVPERTVLCSRWSMVAVQGPDEPSTSVAAAERPVCWHEAPQVH